MAVAPPRQTGSSSSTTTVEGAVGTSANLTPGIKSAITSIIGQTGAVTPSNPAPAPAAAATDWTSDPIYQLVLGQQNLAIKQAQSAALTAETQSLIAYGDPNLAFALTGDQNIAAAAAANKGSTLAQLVAQNAANVRNVNETENKSNLFYSSDRGYQLGLAQQTYLNNASQALASEQGSLGSIQQNLLAQEQASYQNEQQAASDAYNRAIANPVGSPSTTTTTPPPNPGPPDSPNRGGSSPSVTYPAPTKPATGGGVQITSNKTGGSANQKQGVYAVH